ncbi:hypothetical protein D9M68_666510 [compost metagenome]
MSDNLAERNLVLLSPSIHVGIYARAVNEAFNNLPVSAIEIERSGQVNMLFMSTAVDRVILNLPLLNGSIRRLSQFFMRFCRRLLRAA